MQANMRLFFLEIKDFLVNPRFFLIIFIWFGLIGALLGAAKDHKIVQFAKLESAIIFYMLSVFGLMISIEKSWKGKNRIIYLQYDKKTVLINKFIISTIFFLLFLLSATIPVLWTFFHEGVIFEESNINIMLSLFSLFPIGFFIYFLLRFLKVYDYKNTSQKIWINIIVYGGLLLIISFYSSITFSLPIYQSLEKIKYFISALPLINLITIAYVANGDLLFIWPLLANLIALSLFFFFGWNKLASYSKIHFCK